MLPTFSEKYTENIVLDQSLVEPELGVRAVMRSYPVVIAKAVLADARRELTQSGQTFTPLFIDNPLAAYPATSLLMDQLYDGLLDSSGTDLSFIRATQSGKQVYLGNLHHDWKYVAHNPKSGRSGHQMRSNPMQEIWRQVINLGEHPRHLQMIDQSLGQFALQGVDTETLRPRGSWLDISKMADVETDHIEQNETTGLSRVVQIPPYDGTRLHTLEFWASRILHAGITDTRGHFMAAAATWKPV